MKLAAVSESYADYPAPESWATIDGERWLTADQVCDFEAELTGKTPMRASTWRRYVCTGYAPAAGKRIGAKKLDADGNPIGGKPLWSETEIRRWVPARPGQGTRTDLEARP